MKWSNATIWGDPERLKIVAERIFSQAQIPYKVIGENDCGENLLIKFRAESQEFHKEIIDQFVASGPCEGVGHNGVFA